MILILEKSHHRSMNFEFRWSENSFKLQLHHIHYIYNTRILLSMKKKKEPIKPSHTILVPSGKDYIGGDYYFNEEVNPHKDYLFNEIKDNELEILKNSDRRRLNEEDALLSSKIPGLRDAIIHFIFAGCVHTSQGLEFDYVGVIIGYDLKFDTENYKLTADYQEYKDTTGKKGLKNNPEELTKLVKQVYRILISRGMKGCYLFCRDPQLREYIQQRLDVTNKE